MLNLVIKHSLLFLLVTILTYQPSFSYNVLIMPQPGSSHVLSLTALGLELSRRGHNIHLLLPVNQKVPAAIKSSNHTQKIVIERYGKPGETNAELDTDALIENMLKTKADTMSLFATLKPYILEDRIQLLVNNEELLGLLEVIKFDIAVVDSNFMSKHGYLIPLRLGVPWITYTDQLEYLNVRVPYLPSFVPSLLAGPYTDQMSFSQRLINTAFELFMYFNSPLISYHEDIISKYRPYGNFTASLDELVSQSQLFLTTTDIVLDYLKPTMPNTVHVGGLTIVPTDGSTLPAELISFMSEAKHGVVLVTFGSMAASLPMAMARKFLEAFERLGPDYRVIWRLNNKENVTIPAHVKISNWVPQNDLLASGYVKLFITHCGNNGQFEAVYYAVPMIGFPFFGDQPYNARRMEHKGYGLTMNIHDFTGEELFQNLQAVLTDKRYSDRIRKASEIYRSAPETALERAARAIEHVTKYGGDHLRSAGNDLHVYQYFMLDILAAFVVALITLVMVIYTLLSYVVRRVRDRGHKSAGRLTADEKNK